MNNKPYSKAWTQFETQCMAFTKLRMALPSPEYLVRGYDHRIEIYKSTDNHNAPTKLFTILVRASYSKEEIGFFKQTDTEYLLIGGNAAWSIVEKVKPLLL